MAKLKLGPLADDKPVKVAVELPAQLHRDLIDYADPMRGLLENLPDNSITSDLLVQIPVYLFVSRAFPDGQALLQRLDAAFSALEQRGEVQRILATTAYSP